MKLDNALLLASIWIEKLRPFCDRIEVAGSIRRKKPEVKDIEIVCIPKIVEWNDLFQNKIKERHPGFTEAILKAENAEVEMGQPRFGKYIKVMLNDHQIKIDIFICTPENWGYMFAIRTGSADYSHRVLANGWCKAGYHGDSGILRDENEYPVIVQEEKDLFDLIGLPFVEPEFRNWP